MKNSLIERLRSAAEVWDTTWDNGNGDISDLLIESADMIENLQAIIKAHEDLSAIAQSRSQRMKELGFTKRPNTIGVNSFGIATDADE